MCAHLDPFEKTLKIEEVRENGVRSPSSAATRHVAASADLQSSLSGVKLKYELGVKFDWTVLFVLNWLEKLRDRQNMTQNYETSGQFFVSRQFEELGRRPCYTSTT
jgi:hypothetical protein